MHTFSSPHTAPKHRWQVPSIIGTTWPPAVNLANAKLSNWNFRNFRPTYCLIGKCAEHWTGI